MAQIAGTAKPNRSSSSRDRPTTSPTARPSTTWHPDDVGRVRGALVVDAALGTAPGIDWVSELIRARLRTVVRVHRCSGGKWTRDPAGRRWRSGFALSRGRRTSTTTSAVRVLHRPPFAYAHAIGTKRRRRGGQIHLGPVARRRSAGRARDVGSTWPPGGSGSPPRPRMRHGRGRTTVRPVVSRAAVTGTDVRRVGPARAGVDDRDVRRNRLDGLPAPVCPRPAWRAMRIVVGVPANASGRGQIGSRPETWGSTRSPARRPADVGREARRGRRACHRERVSQARPRVTAAGILSSGLLSDADDSSCAGSTTRGSASSARSQRRRVPRRHGRLGQARAARLRAPGNLNVGRGGVPETNGSESGPRGRTTGSGGS